MGGGSMWIEGRGNVGRWVVVRVVCQRESLISISRDLRREAIDALTCCARIHRMQKAALSTDISDIPNRPVRNVQTLRNQILHLIRHKIHEPRMMHLNPLRPIPQQPNITLESFRPSNLHMRLHAIPPNNQYCPLPLNPLPLNLLMRKAVRPPV